MTENKLIYNIIKVSCGFIAGTVLLYYIHDLNFILISIIQLFFYTLFYTLFDRYFLKNMKIDNAINYIESLKDRELFIDLYKHEELAIILNGELRTLLKILKG